MSFCSLALASSAAFLRAVGQSGTRLTSGRCLADALEGLKRRGRGRIAIEPSRLASTIFFTSSGVSFGLGAAAAAAAGAAAWEAMIWVLCARNVTTNRGFSHQYSVEDPPPSSLTF
jgi:hypothetical protein